MSDHMHFISYWDHREMPDSKEINKALKAIAEAGKTPCLIRVDTQSDECGVLITSDVTLSKETASDIFEDIYLSLGEEEE